MQNNRQPEWKKTKKESHHVGPLEVEVRNNDVEQALKVLKHKMSVEGVLAEVKRRKFAEKPSDKKRRKHREAIKKLRKSRGKKVRQRQVSTQDKK
jgi:small subunit ribosomal protein S21